MKLTAVNVEEVFIKCLFTQGEDTTKHMVGKGVAMSAGFHPERLEANRENVISMVKELDSSFHNDGMSFLNLCMTADGSQWGEHRSCDQLVMLASALGVCEILMAKELWPLCPGGVPYLMFKI